MGIAMGYWWPTTVSQHVGALLSRRQRDHVRIHRVTLFSAGCMGVGCDGMDGESGGRAGVRVGYRG